MATFKQLVPWVSNRIGGNTQNTMREQGSAIPTEGEELVARSPTRPMPQTGSRSRVPPANKNKYQHDKAQ